MKKFISKIKETPDYGIGGDFFNQINLPQSNQQVQSHITGFIGKKFKIHKFLLTVEDVIAEGGFGIVFRVRSQTNQIYAMKRICVNNTRDLKVCRREITILSSLTHKNIIPLVDSQINQKEPGIHEVLMLLSYCPNNIVQMMRGKQQMNQNIAESIIVNIICDIIEAVARLHHCVTPVIHRDLKVDNILIDDRGNYVLCDFGSATARQIVPTEYGISKTEEEINKYTTISYRSPEMIQLSSQVIDCKADIWALGCILYYLCFLVLPFGDKVLAIQSGKFHIPANKYSDNIIKLIKYMLTVDPKERPSIYQVSMLAFSLTNRKNPVQNLDRERVPTWDELPMPDNASSNTKDRFTRDSSIKPTNESERSVKRTQTAATVQKALPTELNPKSQLAINERNASSKRSQSMNVATSESIAPAVANTPTNLSPTTSNTSTTTTSINPRNRPRPIKTSQINNNNTNSILLSPKKSSNPFVQKSIELSSNNVEADDLFWTQHQQNLNCDISINTNPFQIEVNNNNSPFDQSLPCKTSEKKTYHTHHRRMFSETSALRDLELELADNHKIKSTKSTQELNRQSSLNESACYPNQVPAWNQCKSASISDNQDALFKAEFD